MGILTVIIVCFKHSKSPFARRHAEKFHIAAVKFFLGATLSGIFYFNYPNWIVINIEWFSETQSQRDWRKFLALFFYEGGKGMTLAATCALARACHTFHGVLRAAGFRVHYLCLCIAVGVNAVT